MSDGGGDSRKWWLIGGGIAVVLLVVVGFLILVNPFAGDSPTSEDGQPSEASAAEVAPTQAEPPAAAGSLVPDGTLSAAEVGNVRYAASLKPSQPGRDPALDELMRKVRVTVTDDLTTARVTLVGTPDRRTISKVKINGTAMKPGDNPRKWSAKVNVRPGFLVTVVMGTDAEATEYRGRVEPLP